MSNDNNNSIGNRENLLDCHGMQFMCKHKEYPNRIINGILSVEGENVYLCQRVLNGAPVKNKFRYPSSYTIDKGALMHLERWHLTDFKLLVD